MIQSRLSLTVVAAGIAIAAAAPAAAQTGTPAFSAVYVFGDSLSDGGNNHLVFGGLSGPAPGSANFIPSLPYAAAPGDRPTYSNGPVWFNAFAIGLGLPSFAAPSLAGGGNHAFGGARMAVDGTGVPPFIPAPFPASVQTQLNAHLSATPIAGNALYVIAGGGNDVRAIAEAAAANPADIAVVTAAGANAYASAAAQMVATLRAGGAGRIVVWNVPDLGLSPAAGAGIGPAAGAASFISSAFNSALGTALAGSGAQIFDLNGLIGSYVAAPAAFGFTNVTQACGFAGNGCNPETSLFWDGIHATAYTQNLVAGAMLTVVPEAGTVWMWMAGLLALGVLLKRRQA